MENQISRIKYMEYIKSFIVDGFLAILAITFPVLNDVIIALVSSFTVVHEFLTEIKDFLNVIVVLLIITKFSVEIYKLIKDK